jgi:hypothetical protein
MFIILSEYLACHFSVYVSVAALKALEASQLSASAISPKRMESENDAFVAVVKEPQTLPSETASAVDCKMVLSSGASMEGYLSSANLLVALSGDQLVATSQLLNPSPELQKVGKNVKLQK